MSAPEPRRGDPLTVSLFPGSTLHAGDIIDGVAVAEMNRVAEAEGWSCRFKLSGSGVDLYYPEPD